jgi:2-amino-4-hydroxy-6-hydroxymethyldihydropteridine diphosphokinase
MVSCRSGGLNRVAIALGSNLGDRRGHILWAAEQISSHLSDGRLSSLIETAPVDVPDTQPPYLNAAFVGLTITDPAALLQILLRFERVRGRERPSFHAPRTLDLDLILHGDNVIETAALVLPHPRFRERLFVLEPLAELVPDWVDPVTGKTMAALLAQARP